LFTAASRGERFARIYKVVTRRPLLSSRSPRLLNYTYGNKPPWRSKNVQLFRSFLIYRLCSGFVAIKYQRVRNECWLSDIVSNTHEITKKKKKNEIVMRPGQRTTFYTLIEYLVFKMFSTRIICYSFRIDFD